MPSAGGELRSAVDTLIVIPNQRLIEISGRTTTTKEAFAQADDVLFQAVRGISQIITEPGLINVDFADVRAIMGEMGMAKGIDKISVDHGRMMLKNARGLFNEVMSGKDMMDMHMGGKTPESDEVMQNTHRLAEAELRVLMLLDDMPGVK